MTRKRRWRPKWTVETTVRDNEPARAGLIGADVAMTSLALLRHGSVPYANRDEPAPFEQANNLRTLHSWTAMV